MLVTYITKYKDHYFNHCVAWFHTFVKQWNRTAFILNYHFNTLETDTCLLISWKSSPALLVLKAFLND